MAQMAKIIQEAVDESGFKLTPQQAEQLEVFEKVEGMILQAPMGQKGDTAEECGLPREWGPALQAVNDAFEYET